MPDQSDQKLAEGRDLIGAFQHELDRFEQHELNLLQDDRKEREQRLAARFATSGLELCFNK